MADEVIKTGMDDMQMDGTSGQTAYSGQVLIVDDVEVNRFVLRNIISDMGYQPILAENGIQGLKLMQKCRPELILLDVAMPEMGGFEFASIVKGDIATRDIPIIFISAYDEVDDIVRGFEIGGEDYITKPFIPEVVKARAGVHLKFHEARHELLESNRRLKTSLSSQLKQIEQEKKGVLYALMNLARRNSMYEEEFIERMQYNCRLVAQAMQLAGVYAGVVTDTFINTIEIAAPLCDIGNVAVPPEILQKKDKLDPYERDRMQTHTLVGSKILHDVALSSEYDDFVQMAADIAHYHHENWDGTGYPDGKHGDDIPLAAQIVAITNVYCALTADRVYRVPYTKEEALRIVGADSGEKFNPEIYSICRKISRQLR